MSKTIKNIETIDNSFVPEKMSKKYGNFHFEKVIAKDAASDAMSLLFTAEKNLRNFEDLNQARGSDRGFHGFDVRDGTPLQQTQQSQEDKEREEFKRLRHETLKREVQVAREAHENARKHYDSLIVSIQELFNELVSFGVSTAEIQKVEDEFVEKAERSMDLERIEKMFKSWTPEMKTAEVERLSRRREEIKNNEIARKAAEQQRQNNRGNFQSRARYGGNRSVQQNRPQQASRQEQFYRPQQGLRDAAKLNK